MAKIFYIDYVPSTRAIGAGLSEDFSSVDTLFSRKLAGGISGVPAYIEAIVGLNAATQSVGWDYFSLGAARGTMVISPHTGNLAIEMTGSIATGMGLSYIGSGALSLNIHTQKSVRETIRNYCERIFTTFPYCH
jgi:hypothetical protein